MGSPEEYLRRNLLVAKAEGIKANSASVLKRLAAQKRPPKWLVGYMQGIHDRAKALPKDLARWRDASPDNPYPQPSEEAEHGR